MPVVVWVTGQSETFLCFSLCSSTLFLLLPLFWPLVLLLWPNSYPNFHFISTTLDATVSFTTNSHFSGSPHCPHQMLDKWALSRRCHPMAATAIHSDNYKICLPTNSTDRKLGINFKRSSSARGLTMAAPSNGQRLPDQRHCWPKWNFIVTNSNRITISIALFASALFPNYGHTHTLF